MAIITFKDASDETVTDRVKFSVTAGADGGFNFEVKIPVVIPEAVTEPIGYNFFFHTPDSASNLAKKGTVDFKTVIKGEVLAYKLRNRASDADSWKQNLVWVQILDATTVVEPTQPSEPGVLSNTVNGKDFFDPDAWTTFTSGDSAIPTKNANGGLDLALPARFDLFWVEGTDGTWYNIAHDANTPEESGIYGTQYNYEFSISADEDFTMILHATNGNPIVFDAGNYRGVYLFFENGKLTIKESGDGKDAVQATADVTLSKTEANTLKVSLTRLEGKIVLELTVNGNKVAVSGEPTFGGIEDGNYWYAPKGFGQRICFIPASGKTLTINSLKITTGSAAPAPSVDVPDEGYVIGDVAVEQEGDKIMLVMYGAYAYDMDAAAIEAITWYNDLQNNDNIAGGGWTRVIKNADVTVSAGNNAFTAKIDITEVAFGNYTSFFLDY